MRVSECSSLRSRSREAIACELALRRDRERGRALRQLQRVTARGDVAGRGPRPAARRAARRRDRRAAAARCARRSPAQRRGREASSSRPRRTCRELLLPLAAIRTLILTAAAEDGAARFAERTGPPTARTGPSRRLQRPGSLRATVASKPGAEWSLKRTPPERFHTQRPRIWRRASVAPLGTRPGGAAELCGPFGARRSRGLRATATCERLRRASVCLSTSSPAPCGPPTRPTRRGRLRAPPPHDPLPRTASRRGWSQQRRCAPSGPGAEPDARAAVTRSPSRRRSHRVLAAVQVPSPTPPAP